MVFEGIDREIDCHQIDTSRDGDPSCRQSLALPGLGRGSVDLVDVDLVDQPRTVGKGVETGAEENVLVNTSIDGR